VKRNIICSAAAFFLASALLPAAAQQERIPEALVTTLPEPTEAALKPAPIHPFAAVAGNWTGGGTIDLTGDIHEKLRCRASYTHGKSNNSLVLAIRCASDNYKFELTSNVVERGGQISGQWNETAYKVSGSISGRVSGNRITATAKGDSFRLRGGNRDNVMTRGAALAAIQPLAIGSQAWRCLLPYSVPLRASSGARRVIGASSGSRPAVRARLRFRGRQRCWRRMIRSRAIIG